MKSENRNSVDRLIRNRIWKFYYRSPLYVRYFYENVYIKKSDSVYAAMTETL